jgi:acyl carrier protein
MSSTADRIAKVIDDLFGLPADALAPDTTLQEGLQLDSLSVVELQVAIEDAFGIRFADTDVDTTEVETVGDLTAAVDSAVEQQRKAS